MTSSSPGGDFSQPKVDIDGQVFDITVLAGGPSSERQVSQASGHAVAHGLTQLGHRVTVLDITPDDFSALDQPADVFFVALHGEFGEDGQVQQMLEDRHLAYCGSGPDGCRNAFNKEKTKLTCSDIDIPTPRFDVAHRAEHIHAATACWSLPVVVKPISQGSSIGVTIVEHADALNDTVAEILSQFGPVLIEQYITGRELTVSIVGGTTLPIIEIRSDRQFYDYQAKYDSDTTQYIFDSVESQLASRLAEMSLRAAEGLGLRDFCRADWILADDGEPYLLEVNAIPGFTEHSLLPKAAAHMAVDMPQLCHHILALAVARHSEQLTAKVTH